MKPTFRFYTSDKSATFTYGDKKLVLKKNDQFQLDSFENRPVVVKDGFRWPIKPTMVRELVKRSSVANITKPNKELVQDFDSLGHKYLKYIERRAKEIDSAAKSGFKDNQVFVYYPELARKIPVVCAILVSPRHISANVYSPEKIGLAGIKQYQDFLQIANSVVQNLKKDGKTVGDFRKLVIHAANISLPWGPKFSGTIYSTAANYA
jgi:hypothetical protein